MVLLQIHHLQKSQSAQLKVHAKKLTSNLQIPDKSLIEFIKQSDQPASSSTGHLSSKDFEIGLHNHLLTCVLSLNLTAYVMDIQCHIIDFIFEHLDVFKVSTGVFDNVEVQDFLGRIITRLLATIHSQLKMQHGGRYCTLEQNGIPVAFSTIVSVSSS
ncbi:hypothetical protein F5I97DRAFT_1832837 [Phlebopus sp. FC_14]|nr:hypothetical protein F5I97DRAFT_1832837 [Phlebopus sp. FC_14]